jgi:polyketide cyclase/dehydrase/lipid transport protein
MSSWRQQALIEAPVEEVWELIGDPAKYPTWAGDDVIEVTGLPAVEVGARFHQVIRTPFGRQEVNFRIEELDELREIRMTCDDSGLYSCWLLTEAQDNTFADVEFGLEPRNIGYRAFDATLGKQWYRRMTDRFIDGLRGTLAARR